MKRTLDKDALYEMFKSSVVIIGTKYASDVYVNGHRIVGKSLTYEHNNKTLNHSPNLHICTDHSALSYTFSAEELQKVFTSSGESFDIDMPVSDWLKTIEKEK